MADFEQRQSYTDDRVDEQKSYEETSKEIAKGDDEGKLFIGALSWDTTPEKLVEYMKKYGEIEACEIKIDAVTRRSRGFGFVKFKDPSAAEAVLNDGPHSLDGRAIDPKRALPVGKQQAMRTKKIFIGGLREETTEETLTEYFEGYSPVKSIDFVLDQQTKRKRGFCFIELGSEDVVDDLVKAQFHTIAGVKVEVKYAFSREQQAQMASRGRGRGSGGRSGPGMYGGGPYGQSYGSPGGQYGAYGGGYAAMGGYGGSGGGAYGAGYYGGGAGGYGGDSGAYGAGAYGGGYEYGGSYGGGGGVRDVRYPDMSGGRGGGFGAMSSYARNSYHPYSR